jgi:DnaK suppressor protein
MKTEHFKKKLEEEKAQLEGQLASVGRRNPSVPNDWEQTPSEDGNEADLIDQADVITTRQNDAAVLDALEARYDTVITALKRIEEGTFGSCEVCGAEIAPERLEANPSATTCALHMR